MQSIFSANSPWRLALLMALVLWGVALLLNWVGSSAARITPQQFHQLKSAGLVQRIAVEGSDLHCYLYRPVRLAQEEGQTVTDQVVWRNGVEDGQLEALKEEGIEIVSAQGGGQAYGEWGGWAMVAALLGLSGWHIWSQIQQDRRGQGSARRRLQELEKEYQAGRISPEEYRQRAEALWAEL
jgi:hypothetical protein